MPEPMAPNPMRPTLVEFGEVIQYAFRNRNQEFLLKLFAASWVVKGFVPFGAREIVDSLKYALFNFNDAVLWPK
jgi:hypothetical protein